jgi:hypothetical protein
MCQCHRSNPPLPVVAAPSDLGSYQANKREFIRTGKEEWKLAMEQHVMTGAELVQIDVNAMHSPAGPPRHGSRHILPYMTGSFGGLIGVVGTMTVPLHHHNRGGVMIVMLLALAIMISNLFGLCWEAAK